MASKRFERTKQSKLFALLGGAPKRTHKQKHAGILAVAIDPQEDPICGLCNDDFRDVYEERDDDDYFEPPGCWSAEFFVSKVQVPPGCAELPLTKHAANLFVAGLVSQKFVDYYDSFFCCSCWKYLVTEFSEVQSTLNKGTDLYHWMSNAVDDGYIHWEVISKSPVKVYSDRDRQSAVLCEKHLGQRFRACKKNDWVMLLDEPGFVLITQDRPQPLGFCTNCTNDGVISEEFEASAAFALRAVRDTPRWHFPPTKLRVRGAC